LTHPLQYVTHWNIWWLHDVYFGTASSRESLDASSGSWQHLPTDGKSIQTESMLRLQLQWSQMQDKWLQISLQPSFYGLQVNPNEMQIYDASSDAANGIRK